MTAVYNTLCSLRFQYSLVIITSRRVELLFTSVLSSRPFPKSTFPRVDRVPCPALLYCGLLELAPSASTAGPMRRAERRTEIFEKGLPEVPFSEARVLGIRSSQGTQTRCASESDRSQCCCD